VLSIVGFLYDSRAQGASASVCPASCVLCTLQENCCVEAPLLPLRSQDLAQRISNRVTQNMPGCMHIGSECSCPLLAGLVLWAKVSYLACFKRIACCGLSCQRCLVADASAVFSSRSRGTRDLQQGSRNAWLNGMCWHAVTHLSVHLVPRG
jgi:hypothetical protein